MKKIALSLVLLLFSALVFAQNHPKVDPYVYEEFNTAATKAVDNGEGVRIVVHLADDSNINLKTSDPQTVADAVLNNQNDFLNQLREEGMMADNRPFGFKARGFSAALLLDHQHAIAGYVSDVSTVERIANKGKVTWVEFDRLNELFTVQGRQLTNSDDVHNSGHRGNNIGVAVIDSNFDLLHPELGGSTSLPNGTVFGGYNYSSNNNQIHSQNFSDCYHGTGVASIVKRYASQADLYALVVFPNSFNSVIANAINWCVTNKNGVNGGAPIKVISMSLGGGQYSGTCNSGAIHTAAGNALSNDILVLAASGNDGFTSATASPSCSNNIISVGSVWDENNASYSPFPPANCSDSNRNVDERTCYSNTSSVLDIYAPSEEVICARCGGGTWALGGTSSACPAAAGMIAQLLSFDGSYAGDKTAVVNLLQSTGATVQGDSSKRRIDLLAAIGGGSGGPGPGTCSGTQYTGTLTGTGDQEFEPNGTYYFSGSSGTHTADLDGTGTDFDLYLWKWTGSWTVVASSTSSNSTESISYNGTSGYYVWRVYSYSGSGTYTLCTTKP